MNEFHFSIAFYINFDVKKEGEEFRIHRVWAPTKVTTNKCSSQPNRTTFYVVFLVMLFHYLRTRLFFDQFEKVRTSS